MAGTTITLFIHGTLPPWPVLNLPIIYDFFYCPTGITSGLTLDNKYHLAQIAQTLNATDPILFPAENFYFFGWSGELSFVARKLAAGKLYKELVQLVGLFKLIKGTKPKLRIITHSHGGNVALNLARTVRSLKNRELIVDELILLACPVQKETAKYTQSGVFKNIYSFHSHIDLFQIIDPQAVHALVTDWHNKGLHYAVSHFHSIGPVLSERHFTNTKKVMQINTTLYGRYMFHIDFLLLEFFRLLPKNLAQLEADRKKSAFRKQACDVFVNFC
jgi:hypothetical protein